MRVLQLISSSGYYGAEQVMVSLSQQLQHSGISTVVGVLQDPDSPRAEVGEVAARQGLPVEWVYCNGRIDRRAGLAIKDLIRRERIDVMHSHGYKSHLYGYFSARGMRCRSVATCHGHYTRATISGVLSVKDVKMRGYREVEHALLGRFDRVIAVSREGVARLKRAGVLTKKVVVIENGTNVDVFESASPAKDLLDIKKESLVGIVARLVHGKGHSQLFEAARGILAECPDTMFVVIGEGPLRQQLEQAACELGIGKRVFFAGNRADMPQVYAALDVVVLPSLAEGTPMAVLEAMAAKRAVVASKVGGIPDMIADNESGCLVEPGNSHQLQESILRVLKDAELRCSFGLRGHEIVCEKFSAAQMARKYLIEYSKITGHTSVHDSDCLAGPSQA